MPESTRWHPWVDDSTGVGSRAWTDEWKGRRWTDEWKEANRGVALQRALYEAVQQGNVTRVREALARGAHVEATLAGARFATRLAPCLGLAARVVSTRPAEYPPVGCHQLHLFHSSPHSAHSMSERNDATGQDTQRVGETRCQLQHAK